MQHKNQYLTGHYRSQTLHLINKYQILKASRSKEESGPLLQLHCTGELWLVIIITKMSNLIQVAEIKNEQNLSTPKSTSQTQMQRLQVQCPYLFTKLTCMQNIVVNYLCLFISDNLIYES